MIVTVTLNAALDVTYTVAELLPGTSHRVASVVENAGGKGVNVASVLCQRGIPVVATGLVGGAVGARIRHNLDVRGVPHDFAECMGESRRTLTVVSEGDGDATVFNEPGPSVDPREWERFLGHFDLLLRHTSGAVAVVSGSLPRGLATDAYVRVIEVAHRAGCRTVLDASGEALVQALAAGADVVKPNREELLEVTGTGDLAAGAVVLQRLGARTVLVSAGSDGMLLVEEDGRAVSARIGQPLRGNPTGAGDAAVAAVAAGLAREAAWTETLADAVAWSAAAVIQPFAGLVGEADVERLRAAVILDPADRADPAVPGDPGARADPADPLRS